MFRAGVGSAILTLLACYFRQNEVPLFYVKCLCNVVVGELYFKRGLDNEVRLTLMTTMFLGLILKINILPFI